MTNKYQVMPDLSPEDYAELKADIQSRGVQVAVEYDEAGNILDGHHRVRACTELGITDWPRVVRVGWTEEQKREQARKLNLARRHMTRDQRRELIRQQVLETPEKSNRQIAQSLGVDHKTVGSQRSELAARGEIPHLSTITGADGKTYPRQVERKPITPCEQCKSAHPGCDDCCKECTDHCNSCQSCHMPKQKPITLYNPTKTEIEVVKDFVATASPEAIQAVAVGKPIASVKQPETAPCEPHEIIRQNTDKAFSTIYDRIIYLSNDYSNIARCLLENPSRTKEDTAEKLSECIERLQHIKSAVLKATALKVVR